MPCSSLDAVKEGELAEVEPVVVSLNVVTEEEGGEEGEETHDWGAQCLHPVGVDVEHDEVHEIVSFSAWHIYSFFIKIIIIKIT